MCVSLLIRSLGLCLICWLGTQAMAQSIVPRLQTEDDWGRLTSPEASEASAVKPPSSNTPLTLRSSPSLNPNPSAQERRLMPTYLRSQILTGRSEIGRAHV